MTIQTAHYNFSQLIALISRFEKAGAKIPETNLKQVLRENKALLRQGGTVEVRLDMLSPAGRSYNASVAL